MAKFELKAVLTAANKISPELKKIMQDVAKVSQKFSGIGKGLGSMAKATLPFVALGGVAAFAGKSILDTTAQFEKYSLVLETIEGSSAKAKSSMDWISDFSAKTPYELAGVTEGFVKLKSYGIDPIKGQTLRVLGDTAAAMGKDLNQAVEALADAVTGENERLKEFGITASKSGSQILYSFIDKSGKQRIAKAKANDRQMIQSTLMAIWNDRYSGAMDKLSGSWSGLLSNMQDQFARFSLMVMQSGAFDWLKNKLGVALDKLNQMAASGELQKLAQTIGVQLVSGLKEAWRAGTAFVGVVMQVRDAVGGWGNLFKLTAAVMAGPLVVATIQTIAAVGSLGMAILKFVRVAAILGRALAVLRVAAMAFMIFSAANPIILAVVAVVALLAGAAYLIYKNWDKIKPYWDKLWAGIKSAAAMVWDWLKIAFSWTPLGMVVNNWSAVAAWLGDFWGGIKSAAAVMWGWLKIAFSWTPLGMVVNNWSAITTWLGGFWNGITGIAAWAFDVLKMAFLNFTPLGLIMKNWDPILGYFKGLMDKIRPILAPITSALDWKNGPTMGDVQLNSGGGGNYSDGRTPVTNANRPNLVGNNQSRVNGEINVRFDNAPAGMRVETPAAKGGVAINPDVGYRSAYLSGG